MADERFFAVEGNIDLSYTQDWNRYVEVDEVNGLYVKLKVPAGLVSKHGANPSMKVAMSYVIQESRFMCTRMSGMSCQTRKSESMAVV